MFDVQRISQPRAQLEQLGSKEKFWFGVDDQKTLFKATQKHPDGTPTGEDWAEKIACELAARMGIPHVHYDLASWVNGAEHRGSVCGNFVPRGWFLVHGNELLQERDSSYPRDPAYKFKVVEHTIDAVFAIVSKMRLPPEPFDQGLPAPVMDAPGVFAGYLLLDAWIANQDRHHENWGALRKNGSLCLAPTFDHGASLARNCTDSEREERMTTRDARRTLAAFVRKAKSAFFSAGITDNPLTPLAAWMEWSRRTPAAAAAWTARLESVDETQVLALLDQVPRTHMTETERRFTLKMLELNRRRILDGDAS
ncbi:MAG: phosphatidylinositol kinase [Deltaproteobacteria bacterium HGW-Deltaproteobacteria-22]|jgi:hypothetical protein|nr:MAG: phosphatidylinositol kinase [Deltaproteobacteria bacterium HGW-Deltaproteobacteria-22]